MFSSDEGHEGTGDGEDIQDALDIVQDAVDIVQDAEPVPGRQSCSIKRAWSNIILS